MNAVGSHLPTVSSGATVGSSSTVSSQNISSDLSGKGQTGFSKLIGQIQNSAQDENHQSPKQDDMDNDSLLSLLMAMLGNNGLLANTNLSVTTGLQKADGDVAKLSVSNALHINSDDLLDKLRSLLKGARTSSSDLAQLTDLFSRIKNELDQSDLSKDAKNQINVLLDKLMQGQSQVDSGKQSVQDLGLRALDLKRTLNPSRAENVSSKNSNAVTIKQADAILPQTGAWVHQLQHQLQTNDHSDHGGHHDQKQSEQGNTVSFNGLMNNLSISQGASLAPNDTKTIQVSASNFNEAFKDVLVKNATLQNGALEKTFTVSLFPQGLGEIKVLVQGATDTGNITIQLQATTDHAKDLLDSSLNSLRSGLEQQGLQVNKMDVTLLPSSDQMSSTAGFMSNQFGSSQDRSQGNGRQQSASSTQVSNHTFQDEWTAIEELDHQTTQPSSINLSA